MSKFPGDPNGYCPTCKKPQDRVALCAECAGRRSSGEEFSDVKVRPPQINTLYKEEQREKQIEEQKKKEAGR